METFIQQIINGLVLGSMYGRWWHWGYTMVYGIINQINPAHGEVLMVGSMKLEPCQVAAPTCRAGCAADLADRRDHRLRRC